jgi:hypothetical protein
MTNQIGRITSHALALAKSTREAPHVCSRSLERSFSNPGSLNSTQPCPPGPSSSFTANGFASAFNQLATDLKSGNLSAGQKDYSAVQQDLQSSAPPAHCHHHHRTSTGIRAT